jgi:hypothetical protein
VQRFQYKCSAIRFDTGINKRLSKTITRCRRPGQMLVVGKPEYRTVLDLSTVSVIPVCFYVCENNFEHYFTVASFQRTPCLEIMHSLVHKEKSGSSLGRTPSP